MKRFVNDVKKHWNYTRYAAKSQLKTEVANSYLNWLWWILEPFCFMLIYAFVFGMLFKRKLEFFNIYIFVGLAFWDFFNRCIKSSVRMVRRNKPIVSKVYLPKFMLLISDMMVNGFKMLICFGISFVMMIFYHVPISYRVLYIIPILLVGVIFTFGCSCLMLHLGVFIDDMSNVINIVLRFLFYLTGIFYSIEESFPKPYRTILLNCNPVACIINDLRRCLIYCQDPGFHVLALWAVISVVVAAIGIRTIYKGENTYVKVI